MNKGSARFSVEKDFIATENIAIAGRVSLMIALRVKMGVIAVYVKQAMDY